MANKKAAKKNFFHRLSTSPTSTQETVASKKLAEHSSPSTNLSIFQQACPFSNKLVQQLSSLYSLCRACCQIPPPQAATGLQAMFRGKKARADVANKKAAKKKKAEEEEVVDIPDDPETNAAATKMQSIQRGKKARKEVEAKRAAS